MSTDDISATPMDPNTPVFPNNTPILFNGNNATISAVLEHFDEWNMRTPTATRADFFTKPMQGKKFHAMRRRIMNEPEA